MSPKVGEEQGTGQQVIKELVTFVRTYMTVQNEKNLNRILVRSKASHFAKRRIARGKFHACRMIDMLGDFFDREVLKNGFIVEFDGLNVKITVHI